MKVVGFLGALLGLAPLTIGLDIERHLGEGLLDSLPEKIQRPARTLKTMLNEHDCLHFDKPQKWGPPEANLFSEEYFPALTALMAAAIGDADFAQYDEDDFFDYDDPQCPNWCKGLNAALNSLRGSYQRDLGLESTEQVTPEEEFYASAPSRARDQLISSFIVFDRVVEKVTEAVGRYTGPQLAAEIATLGSRFEILLMTEIIDGMWDLAILMDNEKAIPDGPYREQFCLAVQKDLPRFTARLGTLFTDLRLAVKELVSTGCVSSWVVTGDFPWECLFYNSNHQHWPEMLRHDPTAHFPSPDKEAREALHHVGARLLCETIVLRLEVTGMVTGSPDQLSQQVHRLTELMGLMAEKVAEPVQALDGRKESAIGDLADFITGPVSTWHGEQRDLIKTTLNSMLGMATASQAGNVIASDLQPEMAACLATGYRVARQLVEFFAKILTLIARECPEGAQKDVFLITLDAASGLRSHLVVAKAFMDRVEDILRGESDLNVVPYEWASFPLLSWFPLPQRPGKRAAS